MAIQPHKKPKKKKPNSTRPATVIQRDPMVVLIIGEMGVGKTYRTNLEVRYYLTDNPTIGKKGRKVLAFDVNMKDYSTFETVNPEYIRALRKIAPRRILPINKEGKPMTSAEKKGIVDSIFDHYQKGMVILDDTDSYMRGAKGQSITKALTTVRHNDIDILFSHQSLSKVTTTQWEACTWIRLHHQVDPITRYRDRVPNYHIVRIAQLIVNEQYDLCARAYGQGMISEAEYKIRRSYFVYIDMRKRKVTGCSRAAFIRAAKRYIDQEEGKTIRLMLNEQNFSGESIYTYKNRNEVVIKLVSEYLRYHDQTGESFV